MKAEKEISEGNTEFRLKQANKWAPKPLDKRLNFTETYISFNTITEKNTFKMKLA